MPNFTFNNKNSFIDMDCIIVGPIKYPVSKELVEYEPVEGRKGGQLTVKTGTYENDVLEIPMQVNYINGYDEEYAEKRQAITEWLLSYSDNENSLIFDDNTDKCYLIKDVVISAFEDYKKFYSRFTVKFICFPFARYVYENFKVIVSGEKILNTGSIETEPIIELKLPATTQNIQININDRIFQLKDVKDSAHIETEIFDCRNEHGNIRTIGEFPILTKGENIITWSGNVTEFKIKPNFKFRG